MCRLVFARTLCPILLSVSAFWLPAAHAGPTYMYKEKNGVVHFSSKPPPTGVEAQVFEARRPRFSWYSVAPIRGNGRLYPAKYNDMIEGAALKYRIDKHLIKAVIHGESGFNPHAVSPKGARGLMQLMPDRARLLGVRNSFDPEQNIDGGTRHLAYLLRLFKGDVRLALAAYNAGEEAVRRNSGIPPYKETQQYVPRVLHLRDRYASSDEKKRRVAQGNK